MPRRRNKKMNGGFWPFDSTSSGYGSSSSGMFGNLFGTSSTRSNTGSGFFSNLFGSKSGYSAPTSYGNQPGYNAQTSYGNQPGYNGGKTRRHRMKGGYKDNTPTTGLATNAAPFSGPTAQPQTIVGGRTRKRRTGRTSRRHRKH